MFSRPLTTDFFQSAIPLIHAGVLQDFQDQLFQGNEAQPQSFDVNPIVVRLRS